MKAWSMLTQLSVASCSIMTLAVPVSALYLDSFTVSLHSAKRQTSEASCLWLGLYKELCSSLSLEPCTSFLDLFTVSLHSSTSSQLPVMAVQGTVYPNPGPLPTWLSWKIIGLRWGHCGIPLFMVLVADALELFLAIIQSWSSLHENCQ